VLFGPLPRQRPIRRKEVPLFYFAESNYGLAAEGCQKSELRPKNYWPPGTDSTGKITAAQQSLDLRIGSPGRIIRRCAPHPFGVALRAIAIGAARRCRRTGLVFLSAVRIDDVWQW
jgi:hypothetical protein